MAPYAEFFAVAIDDDLSLFDDLLLELAPARQIRLLEVVLHELEAGPKPIAFDQLKRLVINYNKLHEVLKEPLLCEPRLLVHCGVESGLLEATADMSEIASL
jgi:hypothetical protein